MNIFSTDQCKEQTTYEFLESLICTDLLLKSQQLNELDEVLFISFSVLLMGRKRHATWTVSLFVLVSGVVLEVKFIWKVPDNQVRSFDIYGVEKTIFVYDGYEEVWIAINLDLKKLTFSTWRQ